jgi:UDPglucose 6-dehydrogenase
MTSHKLTFIGAGYVGLVSGTCLADIGHTVILVDKHQGKIDTLKAGEIPIFEPGLKELVAKNVAAGRLSFTTNLKEAMDVTDVIFIAVNTPADDNGHADLSYVEAAAKEIGELATTSKIIVNKSTGPVTTGSLVSDIVHRHNPHNLDFHVVSNPEFLREGTAIKDFMQGDRVVIGAEDDSAKKVMEEIYQPLNQAIFFTDIKSAELIKYSSNSFLATKISFINAVAQICELTGANIDDVAKGIGMDKRIGNQFLNAGIGYGGSCFPKDVSAYIAIAGEHGYNFDLLKDVETINKAARHMFIKKIQDNLKEVGGNTIAMWGLAFKPNTDDMREAPAITIARELHKAGVKVKAYDPEALETGKAVIGEAAEYIKDKYEALQDADLLIIVTEWDEFKQADWEKVKTTLKNPVILDGRNMFPPKEMKAKGFTYHSVGRG